MNPDIFREYDIRGIADVDLDSPRALRLGRAIGTYFVRRRCGNIVVGRDVRLSSTRLRDDLVAGLTATGIDVVDLGQCPTPALYFALHRLRPHGGIMITGSHNPPQYNGVKVALGDKPVYGEEIRELAEIAVSGRFEEGSGNWKRHDTILDEYTLDLTSRIDRLPRKLRVGVDCGNGAAALVAVRVFQSLGCEVIPLCCEVDGNFPHHHPDPTIEANLAALVELVSTEGADLGVAFDGDGDRIGVVDDSSEIIWGDELMILFSRSILSQHPGAAIVADVKCSKLLFEEIAERGGRPVMWKTGHAVTRAKMVEEGALLAGELSGHVFFGDRHYGYDDGIYAAARLLEICASSRRRLSTMLEDLPQTFRSIEIRRPCSDQHKFEVERRAREYFAGSFEAIEVDGVRVIFDDGWGLLRASNTEPVIVLRFEAETKKRLDSIRQLFQDKLDEIISEISAGE